MMWKPELLSPAGSLDKLKAAVAYGANAVYLAGQKFGLRSAAENFTRDELEEGLQFAHTRGAQIYVVLNSFPHDSDIQTLPEFVGQIAELGVDGVIASDMGVIATVRQQSSLPVHLSTQASCLNIESGKLWKKTGVTRLILGREVSIADAGRIKKATGLEVELFIHGSMCMAYSGNCTISNFTKGRDSNRGGCAQSCRFSYTLESPDRAHSEAQTYFMSSKDLLGLDLLPQFFESQIDSIKIEGRMRSPLYAGVTAKIYREALDLFAAQGTLPEERLHAWHTELSKVPHREYMTGSLLNPAEKNSTLSRSASEAEPSEEFEFVGLVRKIYPEKNQMLVEVRTLFGPNDTLELVPFSGPAQKLPHPLPLQNALGTPLEHAKVSTLVRLPLIHSAQEGCFLRKEGRRK